MKLSHKLEGIALLSHNQLRLKLEQDIQKWLDNGNQITRLPTGRKAVASHYSSMKDLIIETGLYYEY